MKMQLGTALAPVVALLFLWQPQSSIAGKWLVTLAEADGVELRFRMTFADIGAKSSDKWEAYTRAGAAREMVGGSTAMLGRLLGKMPPHEALIYIGQGSAEVHSDTIALTGRLESPFLGRRLFNGSIVGTRIHAELRREGQSEVAGTIDATRYSTDTPLRDYSRLAKVLEDTIRAIIFDPRVAAQPEFATFFSELRSRFSKARDDLDAVASFQALKPSLKTSHIDFIRNPRLAASSLDSIVAGDPKVDVDKFVTFGFPAPGIALLRVTKWDRVAPAIDRAFARIDSIKPRVLIVDIRDNPGGDATSMALLTHVLRDTTTVGAFLGRKWYATHSNPPSFAELSGLPILSTNDQPLQLINDVRSKGAVVGRVVPRQPYFDGPIYLLINNGSASASEPLARVLKTTHRATLIGDHTAGAMLTALPHSLTDGWVVIVPEANFVAADGTRLEGAGVQPDIQSAPNDVYLKLADQLSSSDPYGAAVIRGGSYFSLRRFPEAERSYREALRISEKQTPAPSARSLASIHRTLATILTDRGDRDVARRELQEALRLVPTDADARAALQKLDSR